MPLPRPGTSRARTCRAARWSASAHTSQALANQRQLTFYTPPGYDPEGQRYPLLVLFDEDHYARDVPTPTILDNLIAAGRIRPTLAVIVGNVDASSRGRELPCNEAFADMLAHELLPWLQQRYALSEEPADRVLSGSSYGGLASGCIAYRYPERFGKVLSLSGSFWWGPDEQQPQWLVRQVAAGERLPLTFFLSSGLLESPRRTAFSAATAACARRCKARATRCTTVSSPAVTTTRRGAWSLPKGCRPCCRRIEPAGWRGADSRLRLSAVPRPRGGGRLSGACPQCPPRCGIGKNRPGPFASVGG
ncbi:alpha/beta hydrolase-fold protein [Pseudomonas aeruginosa]|nr:alpha/beta hydrolase-fold protein [Pseudomonas aeruginosa]